MIHTLFHLPRTFRCSWNQLRPGLCNIPTNTHTNIPFMVFVYLQIFMGSLGGRVCLPVHMMGSIPLSTFVSFACSCLVLCNLCPSQWKESRSESARVYAQDRTLFSSRKNQSSDTYHIGMNLKTSGHVKKSDTRNHIPHDFSFVRYFRRQIHRDRKWNMAVWGDKIRD